MNLFEELERNKNDRKYYRVKPFLKFNIDRVYYYFSFIPTILWCPWTRRNINSIGVIDIWWLNFHILIGEWDFISDEKLTYMK